MRRVSLDMVMQEVVFLRIKEMMMNPVSEHKPIIGITCGDINGIGTEIIIKVMSDSRILDICTPVIFANNKLINFYRKSLPEHNINFSAVKDSSKMNV